MSPNEKSIGSGILVLILEEEKQKVFLSSIHISCIYAHNDKLSSSYP